MHTTHKDVNVTTSKVGLKKMITYTKILPKMVNPRDIAGNAEEEARKLKPQHKSQSNNYSSISGNVHSILTSMTLRILSCPKKVMKYMGSSSKLLAQPSKWSRCLLRLDLRYRTSNIGFSLLCHTKNSVIQMIQLDQINWDHYGTWYRVCYWFFHPKLLTKKRGEKWKWSRWR